MDKHAALRKWSVVTRFSHEGADQALHGDSCELILKYCTSLNLVHSHTWYLIPRVSFPTSRFIFFIGQARPSRCHTPPPVFLPWGENMVCTSGGDPDSPVGKGCQVKDTLHSVCLNPRVHVCLEGVMWSGPQMLLITNSWRDPASANQTSRWLWHQEEGGASKLGIFILIYSFLGQMWSSKRFWQNLK